MNVKILVWKGEDNTLIKNLYSLDKKVVKLSLSQDETSLYSFFFDGTICNFILDSDTLK